jgi:hypothetical protein
LPGNTPSAIITAEQRAWSAITRIDMPSSLSSTYCRPEALAVKSR